jgi:hypothetical protein
MRALLCVAILYTLGIGVPHLWRADASRVAFQYPASASDLKNFYRAIRALTGNPLINETATAIA